MSLFKQAKKYLDTSSKEFHERFILILLIFTMEIIVRIFKSKMKILYNK